MDAKAYGLFREPTAEYRAIPKWIWNVEVDAITEEGIRAQLEGFRDLDGYGGAMFVIWGSKNYMDGPFLERYGTALRVARECGLTVILWDENGFPSGFAGGLIEERHPEHAAKRLDMVSEVVPMSRADRRYERALPEGRLMAAVAMDVDTYERLDLTDKAEGGRLRFTAPPGNWKVMAFTLVTAEASQLGRGQKRKVVDYLSEAAVDAFIGCTHEAYYGRFKEYFGSTVRYAFYDEPAFWKVAGGRIWTGDFNEAFEARHGYGPATLYPALFMDVGPDTASARNAMLTLRADMYAERYVARMAEWCDGHGIRLTGHMDQEEVPSPVHICGDLMKALGRQHIPGVDEIGYYGRGSAAYKLVSSSANNYDKGEVMSETFGGMGADMPVPVLLKD
ncbi:MAG: hypothetical protein FWE70_02680, partial [Oscillospiraceae bacterium]|nr:hypothetical protein [Oscillospiraceae bacterium]